MAYYTPRKEDMIIEKPEKGQEFCLVKYQTKNEYEDAQIYLVSNYDKVSVTFGDDVVVSYCPNGEKDHHLPNTTARVIAMLNDQSDEIFRTLYNKDYVSMLEEMEVKWHGEKIICNITNPSSPKGSGSGGMTVTGQDENGEPIDSSPSTDSNGDNNGKSSGKSSKEDKSTGDKYDVGHFGEEKELKTDATDEVLVGKIFTFKRKR